MHAAHVAWGNKLNDVNRVLEAAHAVSARLRGQLAYAPTL